MTGSALHTNEILQRCMQDLVLNKIVIEITAKNLINIVYISTWISVNNKFAYICDVFCSTFLFQYTFIVHFLPQIIYYIASYPCETKKKCSRVEFPHQLIFPRMGFHYILMSPVLEKKKSAVCTEAVIRVGGESNISEFPLKVNSLN